MHTGRYIFSQVVDFFPERDFRRIVAKYQGDYKTSTLSSWEQLLAFSFAQVTFRESLRDVEDCLRPRQNQLYHLGFCHPIARSTLADANATRDWRIFEEFGLLLIARARQLCADEPSGIDELDATIYAIDSTTIELCLSIFPWAHFRTSKAAVKVHTLLELRGPLPALVYITDGKTHDVNWLDSLCFELGCFYLLDRGYIDFGRLYRIAQAEAFFVTRAKSTLAFYRCHSQIPQGDGVIADQVIRLTDPKSKAAYPDKLRRIVYRDPETKKLLVFLTNNWREAPSGWPSRFFPDKPLDLDFRYVGLKTAFSWSLLIKVNVIVNCELHMRSGPEERRHAAVLEHKPHLLIL